MRLAIIAFGLLSSILGFTWAGTGTKVVGTPAAGTQAWKIFNDKMSLTILPVGAVIHSLEVPDREGKMRDVVLGFQNASEYQAHGPYLGAIVGRVANRIAKGKFMIGEKGYKVTCNDNGKNSLHGGAKGFDKKIWNCTPVKGGVELTLRSPAGDEGYPGTVDVVVRYILVGTSLEVTMTATCDSDTPVNLAQHSYFNLAGHDSGSILGCEISIDADGYMPTNAESIPTGEIAAVAGSPFDFTEPALIGTQMNELASKLGIRAPWDDRTREPAAALPELSSPGGARSSAPLGFDHNYALRRGNVLARLVRRLFRGGMRSVATVNDAASGTRMTVTSNAPGVQFYTGNYLDGIKGKGGAQYHQHSGFCLETQTFPDSINAVPGSAVSQGATRILRRGQTYTHKLVYHFSTV